MERKNDFNQEELVLAGVFEKPVVFYKENPLPKVFENIKFNATLYEEVTNSNEKFVTNNWDFYLPFAEKGRLTSLRKMLANVMLSKEFGTNSYVHFMTWICCAWIIQAITGAKIFEIDNSGTDDTLLPGYEQDDSNYKGFLIALCQLGKKTKSEL